ncbi:MAG TPA: sigma-70 family RNA polymerase sigma factor [Planctomycetota bacterium]|nr:sigma-70 family RNA polymerase sigma factor [Planctomycetota bacterium]
MDSEDGLVKRASGGDRGAFEELVRRTTRLVYSRLYLETGSREQAEDLVQETYLRAFRSIRQVTDPRGFRSWLLAVAQSAAVDAYRLGSARRRSAPPRVSQEAIAGQAAPAEESPDLVERREKVRSVLQGLPEEYRLPLTLRYLDGADYGTITLQLGLSAGALRGLLYRGLQLLRRAVKSEVSNESR